MKIKALNEKINIQKLSYFSLFLLVLKAALYPSTYISYPSMIDNIIELFCYSCWLIAIINDDTKKNLNIFFSICSLCILTGFLTKTFIMLSSFLLFYISKMLDYKKIIKIMYKTVFAILVIHFGLFLIDLMSGNVVEIADIYGRVRYGIGFSHPNSAGFLAAWCFFGYCYCNDKFSKKLIAFGLLMVVFYFTNCRTLLYTSIIYLVIDKLKNIKNFKNIIINAPKYTYVFLTIFIIISVISLNNGGFIGNFVDKITNQRIYYASRAFKIYGPTLFGRYVEIKTNLYGVNPWDWLVLDNYYMYCIYGYGIIYLVFVYFICVFISKQKDINKSIMMIVWCVYAIFELSSMNFLIAFAPIFGSTLFLNKNKNDEMIKEVDS